MSPPSIFVSPARRPRPWLLIILLGFSLFVLLFKLYLGDRLGREPVARGFDCPADPRQNQADYDDNLKAGREAFAEHDFPNARNKFNKALCSRDLPEARIRFAKTLLALDQPKRAERVATEGLHRSTKPTEEQRLELKALIMAGAGDWKLAGQYYRELLRRQPENAEHVLDLAKAQYAAGKPQDALDTVTAASAGSDPTLAARLALIETKAAQETKQLDRAREAASRAIVAAGKQYPFLAAEGHLELGSILCLQSNREAVGEAEQAEILAADNDALLSDVLNVKMWIFTQLQDYQRALIEYKKAASHQHIHETEGGSSRAAAHTNLAIIFNMTDDLRASRKNHEIALYELTSGWTADNFPKKTANVETNLGAVLLALGDLREAKENLTRAIEIYRSLHSEFDEASGHCSRSEIGRLLLEIDEPSADAQRCRMQAESAGDPSLLGEALAVQGDLDLWQGNLDRALAMHQEALRLRQQVDEGEFIAESRLALASIEIERGQPAAAMAPVRQALQYYTEQKMMDRASLARVRLAEIQLAQRNVTAARAEINRAEQRAAESQLLDLRVHSALTAARVADAEGKTADALAAARRALAEAEGHDHPAFRLDAGLVLGELEIRHPDPKAPNRGCERLRQVEEAAQRVYGLVEQKARALREAASPACPAPQ